MAPPRNARTFTDVLIGVLWVLGGAVLLLGTWMRVIPSLSSLAALILVAGLVGAACAIAGTTSAGFFTQILSASLWIVIGGLMLRDLGQGPILGLTLAAGLFLVNGLVRVASATEFPGLRGALMTAGAAALALGAVCLSGAVSSTLPALASVMGLAMLVDGLLALTVARHG